MTIARRSALATAAFLALALAGCSERQGGPVAASTTAGSSRAEIDAEVEAALESLHKLRPGTQQLTRQARAVLVFPNITQAGLGIGGLYGNGAMREDGRTIGYYNIAGGTIGLQAGAQSFSQAYFFNSAQALETFRDTLGFQLGADATLVAADFGADGAITTSTLQKPVVVATWGQSGLMAGLTVEGSKITEINP
jgi:lipid-binding SYLF domain-containing protein